MACRCGAPSRSRTRCSPDRAASCCARPTTACRRRWPCCIACSAHETLLLESPVIMKLHRTEQVATIRALRGAAPYIRLYKGRIFVVKAGGGVFGDAELTRALMEPIAILTYLAERGVMVHG